MQLKDEPRSGLGKVGQCILPARGAAGLKSIGEGGSGCRAIRGSLSARGRLEACPTLYRMSPSLAARQGTPDQETGPCKAKGDSRAFCGPRALAWRGMGLFAGLLAGTALKAQPIERQRLVSLPGANHSTPKTAHPAEIAAHTGAVSTHTRAMSVNTTPMSADTGAVSARTAAGPRAVGRSAPDMPPDVGRPGSPLPADDCQPAFPIRPALPDPQSGAHNHPEQTPPPPAWPGRHHDRTG